MSIVFSIVLLTATLFGHHSAGTHEGTGQVQLCQYVDGNGNGILYTAEFC